MAEANISVFTSWRGGDCVPMRSRCPWRSESVDGLALAAEVAKRHVTPPTITRQSYPPLPLFFFEADTLARSGFRSNVRCEHLAAPFPFFPLSRSAAARRGRVSGSRHGFRMGGGPVRGRRGDVGGLTAVDKAGRRARAGPGQGPMWAVSVGRLVSCRDGTQRERERTCRTISRRDQVQAEEASINIFRWT